MYNFGVPSTLKAYFDHVARARETFRYTETGPEGLLKGKKAYVFAARGGVYLGTSHDTEIATLGIDSLGALIFVAELENLLETRIPDGLLAGVRTLGDLEQRLGAVARPVP